MLKKITVDHALQLYRDLNRIRKEILPPKYQQCPEDLLPQVKFRYIHPNFQSDL